MPAREVGGDFFDFIEMGEDRVGSPGRGRDREERVRSSRHVCFRSVFRMLSEEKLGVGEIMIRANRRTKKDIKSGMFVALLYAVLDSKEKAAQPVQRRADPTRLFLFSNGEAKLLRDRGGHLPSGHSR